jgi:hypothetical protein
MDQQPLLEAMSVGRSDRLRDVQAAASPDKDGERIRARPRTPR